MIDKHLNDVSTLKAKAAVIFKVLYEMNHPPYFFQKKTNNQNIKCHLTNP